MNPKTQQEIQRISEKCAEPLFMSIYGDTKYTPGDSTHKAINRRRTEFQGQFITALTELATPLVEKIEQLEQMIMRYESSCKVGTATEKMMMVNENVQHQSYIIELKQQMVGLRREIQHQKNRVDAYELQNKVLREALTTCRSGFDYLSSHINCTAYLRSCDEALSTTQPQPTEKEDEGK